MPQCSNMSWYNSITSRNMRNFCLKFDELIFCCIIWSWTKKCGSAGGRGVVKAEYLETCSVYAFHEWPLSTGMMSPTLAYSPSCHRTLSPSRPPLLIKVWGRMVAGFKHWQFAEPPHQSSSSSSSSSCCFFNQPSWPTSAAPSSQFVYANGHSFWRGSITSIFGNPDAADDMRATLRGLWKCAFSDCTWFTIIEVRL